MPYVFEKGVCIDALLAHDLLEHRVDHNIATRTANASATMYNSRTAELGILFGRSPDETQYRQYVVRHAMVGPVREMVLVNQTLRI